MSRVYISNDVQKVRSLHQDLLNADLRRLPVCAQLEQQARRILDAHRRQDQTVVTHVTCWHPELVGHSASQIMAADFPVNDARETMAREYRFEDWDDVRQKGTEAPNINFEGAVDALLAGDLKELSSLLEQHPDLVRARSSYGHQATLLHYVGSNGVETHRQVVPANLAAVTQVLLDAGANVNAEANIYGGGTQTLGLLITSDHPDAAGVVNDVVRVLADAGAETDDS